MRVCFVLEHYHPYIGGAEKLFKSLAEGLVTNGHEVRVVTTRYARDLPRNEIIGGVEIKRVTALGRYAFTLASLPAVLRWARWADVIHTTSYNAALPAYVGARLRGKPIVITFHEVWGKLWNELPGMSSLSKWMHKKYERFIVRRKYTRIVGVSEFTHRALLDNGVKSSRLAMIYNGLDYTPFLNPDHQPPNAFRCCYFGRLGPSKGVDLLIHGWKTFSASHPEARLVLVIPTRPVKSFRRLQALLNELQISASIELRHELSEPELRMEILRSSCVIIPSLSEGFCFAAVEACALGVPVISSQRGALPEVISGRFLPIAQLSEAGIAEALDRALQGHWDHAPNKRFEIGPMIQKYAELYTTVIGEKKKPRQRPGLPY